LPEKLWADETSEKKYWGELDTGVNPKREGK